mmetsp:Transcript_2471/g.9074  ORF Transcript_2471/g.9074 Transcript_2471/m.9074 type:complete len:692 (+) Transcript_2471:109-2184(+)
MCGIGSPALRSIVDAFVEACLVRCLEELGEGDATGGGRQGAATSAGGAHVAAARSHGRARRHGARAERGGARLAAASLASRVVAESFGEVDGALVLELDSGGGGGRGGRSRRELLLVRRIEKRRVVSLDGAAGDVVLRVDPLLLPEHRLGRAAGDRLADGDGGELRRARVVLLEEGAEKVVLLRLGRAQREALRALGEILVRYLVLSVLLEAIDPVVPDAVAELLLLAPEHLLRQVRVLRRVESLAQEVLLHARVHSVGLLLAVDHLVLGRDVHRVLEHRLVEERDAAFDAPRKQALVGSHHVPLVEPRRLTHALLVKLLGARRLVEVQIAPELLVRTLAAQHHLDAERFDFAREEKHRHARADLLKALDVVDDVRERVERLLRREVELVVLRPEHVRHLARRDEVGGARDTDAEGVNLGRVAAVVHLAAVALHDGRHERAVEPAAEQHTEGGVAHQPLLHRIDHAAAQLGEVGLVRGNRPREVLPRSLVPALETLAAWPARVLVTGRENLHALHALVLERLHLAREKDGAVLAVPDVHWGDAHVVPRGEKRALLLVHQHKGKVAVELRHERRPELFVQVSNHLAVRLGGDVVQVVLLPQEGVVVNLAVDDPSKLVVFAGANKQRLLPGRIVGHVGPLVGADDREALVGEKVARAVSPDRAAVRPTMTYLARELQYGFAIIAIRARETESR